MGVIWLTLSRSVVHNVVKEKTTVDLIKVLSSMYEKPVDTWFCGLSHWELDIPSRPLKSQDHFYDMQWMN